MRIVELKCDAVAMLTLKLKGLDPHRYLNGLRRLAELREDKGYNSALSWMHPSLVERAQFAQRFIKLLARSPGGSLASR